MVPKHCKVLVSDRLNNTKIRSYSYTDLNQLISTTQVSLGPPNTPRSSRLTLLLASLTTAVLGLAAGLAIGLLGPEIGLPLALLGITMIGAVILISFKVFTKLHRPGYQRVSGYDFSHNVRQV